MKRGGLRFFLGVLYVLVCFGLLLTGRRYVLLIDNDASVISGGGSLSESELFVRVDGGEPVELLAKDRVEVKVKGLFHTLEVLTKSENGEAGEVRHKVDFRLVRGDTFLVSVPAIQINRQDWLQPFVVEDAPAVEEASTPSPEGSDPLAPTPVIDVTPVAP